MFDVLMMVIMLSIIINGQPVCESLRLVPKNRVFVCLLYRQRRELREI